MTTQPDALRLADALLNQVETNGDWSQEQVAEAAAELRRLHEVNVTFLAALKALNSHIGMNAREQIEIERFVKVAIAKGEQK